MGGNALRLFHVLTIAFFAVGTPLAASAQEVVEADAIETATADAIDEVIVTASKRAESLQDTLGSVTALGGEALAQNNVQDFNSLVDLVPGMVAQDEEKIAIRGISRTRDGPSPVAFHVNDVFIAMRGEPFYDLEAVEILRGPSGTVFGRNATAGAINAKWRRPADDWQAGGKLRYSSLEDQQLHAFLNVPFLGAGDERLLGRFAFMMRKADGIMDNLLTQDDRDPGALDDYFGRAYLTSAVTDNLHLSLRAIHYQDDGGSRAVVASPTLATRASGVLEEAEAQSLPADLTIVRSRAEQTYGKAFDRFTRIDGQMDWSLTDLPLLGEMDVVLVGGYQWRSFRDTFDLDGTEQPLTEGHKNQRDDHRSTAELRFVSAGDTGLDWLVGLFWYKQTAISDLDVRARAFASLSDLGAGPSFPGEPEFLVDTKILYRGEHHLDQSYAAFLNMDFNLAKLFDWADITLSAGIRQNYDEFGKNTDNTSINVTPRAVGLISIPVTNSPNLVQEADFSATTGEVAARWFYNDNAMAYAKLSRGYKPGLAQRLDRADGSSIQNPVEPEYLTAFEAGWKASFLDRRVQVNLAAYHYAYTDLQVSQITPGGVLTENAAEATINGAEFELRWMPDAAFFLMASGAWTDATYDEYCGNDPALGTSVPVDAGCTAANPSDFSGARMTAAPRFSFALLASYTWQLDRFGAVTASLKSSWSDEMDRRGLGNPVDAIDAYSSTDLRLSWESIDQHWMVELFAENLEDNNDVFFQAYTPLVQGRDSSMSVLSNIPPRLIGVTVEARF